MNKAKQLAPWTEGACDECGCSYQLTRSVGRQRKERELCGECDGYFRGYTDGRASLEPLTQRWARWAERLNRTNGHDRAELGALDIEQRELTALSRAAGLLEPS